MSKLASQSVLTTVSLGIACHITSGYINTAKRREQGTRAGAQGQQPQIHAAYGISLHSQTCLGDS